MDDVTYPLSEIARRLGQLRKLKKRKLDVSGLLGLLKAGHLRTGFYLPGPTVKWLDIPADFWVTVNMNELRAIVFKEARPNRKGTFTVHISKFADTYINTLRKYVDGLEKQSERYDILLEEMKNGS
jgi:hypothetical protein